VEGGAVMGGGGGPSGGSYKMTGHKLPETGKPDSSIHAMITGEINGKQDTMIQMERSTRILIMKARLITIIRMTIIGGKTAMVIGTEPHMEEVTKND
jgi:hypothetical protein